MGNGYGQLILMDASGNPINVADILKTINTGISSPTGTQPVSIATLPTLANVTTLGTLTTMTTGNVVSKNLPAVTTIANLAASGTFTSPIIDAGSTMLYTKIRFRIMASQPLTVEIRNGTSATVTSNQLAVDTITTVAGKPYVIDVPLIARYASIKITNGATATTYCEVHQMLLGQ